MAIAVKTPATTAVKTPVKSGRQSHAQALPPPYASGKGNIGGHTGTPTWHTPQNGWGWGDPSPGRWVNPWGQKVPNPPDYGGITRNVKLANGDRTITKWHGPTLQYLLALTNYSDAISPTGADPGFPANFNNYDPITVARIKSWIRKWAPDGVQATDLGKNSDKQIGTMFLSIVTGTVGFDAGAATPDKIPVLDNITSTLDAIKKVLGVLFDPNFWLRVAEFAIGAILIGVGLSHISSQADEAIKSIPVYGKAVNRAMHPATRRSYQGRHTA